VLPLPAHPEFDDLQVVVVVAEAAAVVKLTTAVGVTTSATASIAARGRRFMKSLRMNYPVSPII
jgi:hypothetical protein